MSKSGPVIIVEKDITLKLLYQTILKDIKVRNQLLFFETANEALFYLKNASEDPFLIICNTVLPRMSGLDLKRKINNSAYLKTKSTPFILFSESASRTLMNRAFELGINGLFTKATNYEDLKYNFSAIVNYWSESLEYNHWINKDVHAQALTA